VSQNHDDIAKRLRDEASATAPERLRADIMLRVRAEPRPQRIRPRRSFGRSFATVAAAACILGAMVFGLSRVDFSEHGAASGGGASVAAEKALPQGFGASGGGGVQSGQGAVTPPRPSAARTFGGARSQAVQALTAVPRPLKAAILGRYSLAPPLREAFGAIDPHHGLNRR
jgi:hypothetical protein